MRTLEVVGLTLIVAATAVGVAWLLLRAGIVRAPFDFGPVEEMLGAMFGVLLAILVLFASEHYADARSHAEQEAAGLNDIFRIAGDYSPAERDPLQHDVVCYAREAILYDWSSGSQDGSPILNARASQLHRDAQTIAVNHPQSYLLSSLFDGVTKASDGHQLRLADRQGRVPSVVWVVIYIGVGVLMLFLALEYLPDNRHRLLALPAATVVLASMTIVIYMLDHPYGSAIRLQPRGLHSLLRTVSLTSGRPLPASVLAPCQIVKPNPVPANPNTLPKDVPAG
jgi:predicted membrane channel-forming protein YqfA (hemolysin III family)